MSDEIKKDESAVEASDTPAELSEEQLEDAAGGIIEDKKTTRENDAADKIPPGHDDREPLATTW